MSGNDQQSEDSSNMDPIPMSMTLVSTHRVNLKHVYSFTVMQTTGDVILWGQGPRKLMQGVRGNPCAFHIYNNTSDGWFKQRTVGALCKHMIVNMLPVTLDQKGELLAVSCALCHVIRLHDLTSGETLTAFRANDGKALGHMCHGESGTMFVSYKRHPQDYRVLELGCTTTKFRALKSYAMGISMRQEPPKISYIPTSKLIVACSNRPSKMIRAISCSDSGQLRKSLSCSDDTGDNDTEVDDKSEAEKATWQHWYAFHTEHHPDSAEDDGDISPSDMYFSAASGRLIVGDLLHNRLVVLNPEDGTQLQALPLTTPGWVEQICPYDLKWYRVSPASHPSLLNRVLCGGGSSEETKGKAADAPASKTEQPETTATIAVWLDNPYSAKQKQTVSFFTVK